MFGELVRVRRIARFHTVFKLSRDTPGAWLRLASHPSTQAKQDSTMIRSMHVPDAFPLSSPSPMDGLENSAFRINFQILIGGTLSKTTKQFTFQCRRRRSHGAFIGTCMTGLVCAMRVCKHWHLCTCQATRAVSRATPLKRYGGHTPSLAHWYSRGR